MQDFGSLKLLVALLGTSSLLLGPIWSQNGPQNGSQNCQTVVQTIVKTTTPKHVIFKQILAPKMCPKIRHFGGATAQADPAGDLLKGFLFFSRWLQDGSRWPQVAQDSLLGAWTPKNFEKPLVF